MGREIIQTDYTEKMKKSYLDYSMSVITSRAVPDIRDGLKPVQRRILYDMNELHVNSDKPTLKSARISGDTMGKYHPHGDSSIYDTLVVMAQPFKKMQPMIDGQGNFGNIEGDSAAAPRYTEARLSKYADDVMLQNMETTVDFIPNYDGKLKEPTVLPARLPNFLINGSEGIAVGMATSTPSHNLGEIVDLAIAYIKNPEITLSEMLKIMPGPDFPTGGIITNQNELATIYENGCGKIKIRGKIKFEQGKKRGEKDKLVITEIPYTMIGAGISKFMQDVADLCDKRILPEIIDISNQSDKEGMRIVIELKRDSNVDRISNILYKETKLEDTFGVNMLAIHNGRPQVMNLTEILAAYTEFQYDLYSRQYSLLLQKEKERKEISDGLIKAIDAIDAIIAVIRNSSNQSDAKHVLTTGDISKIKLPSNEIKKQVKTFSFSPMQAQAILDMKLGRLIGLELNALIKANKESAKRIDEYELILSSKSKMNNLIIKQLKEYKKNFATNRKTEITNLKAATYEKNAEVLDVYYVQDKFNYAKLFDVSTYERNKDAIIETAKYIIKTVSDDSIAIFTDYGSLHLIRLSDVPLCKFKDKGIPIDNISKFETANETILYLDSYKNILDSKLIFINAAGNGKVVNGSEFDVTTKTSKAYPVKNGVKVIFIQNANNKIPELISSKKKKYKIKLENLIEMKKTAMGNKMFKLSDDEMLISPVI